MGERTWLITLYITLYISGIKKIVVPEPVSYYNIAKSKLINNNSITMVGEENGIQFKVR